MQATTGQSQHELSTGQTGPLMSTQQSETK